MNFLEDKTASRCLGLGRTNMRDHVWHILITQKSKVTLDIQFYFKMKSMLMFASVYKMWPLVSVSVVPFKILGTISLNPV